MPIYFYIATQTIREDRDESKKLTDPVIVKTVIEADLPGEAIEQGNMLVAEKHPHLSIDLFDCHVQLGE